MSKTNILVIGGTGYIGGSVLHRLLEHPDFDSFVITALVRDADKAAKLRTLDINAVIGSTSDLALVESLSVEADIVLEMADSDDLAAIKALLSGAKTRYEAKKVPSTFIHFSGTGALADDAEGMYASDKVYTDLKQDEIHSLPADGYHRNVHLEIITADEQGYIKSYLIFPPFVFGEARNRLTDMGIQRSINRVIPMFIAMALERGAPGYIGEGKSLFGCVDNDEHADLTIFLFNAVISGQESLGHGSNGYYFAENEDYSWKEFSTAIALGMYEAGRLPSPEVRSFTPEEAIKYIPSPHLRQAFGGNGRAKAERALALGWKPTRGKDDLLNDLQSTAKKLILGSIMFK